MLEALRELKARHVEPVARPLNFLYTPPHTPEPLPPTSRRTGVGGLGNGPPACKALLRKMHFAREEQGHDMRNRSHHWVQEGRIDITLRIQQSRRRRQAHQIVELHRIRAVFSSLLPPGRRGVSSRPRQTSSKRSIAGLEGPAHIVGQHGWSNTSAQRKRLVPTVMKLSSWSSQVFALEEHFRAAEAFDVNSDDFPSGSSYVRAGRTLPRSGSVMAPTVMNHHDLHRRWS